MCDDEEADEQEFLAFQQRSAGAPAPDKVKTRARKTADRFAMVPIWWVEQAAKATNTPRALMLVWLLYLVVPAHKREAAWSAPQHEIQNAVGAGSGGADPGLKGRQKGSPRDPALSLAPCPDWGMCMPWLGHQVLLLSSLSCLSRIYGWKVQSVRSSRRALQQPTHRGLNRPFDVTIGRERGLVVGERERHGHAASSGLRLATSNSARSPGSHCRSPGSHCLVRVRYSSSLSSSLIGGWSSSIHHAQGRVPGAPR